ncbi:hypothetical protein F5879DRAFT_962833 [Lentinula edodes]|nr:hypothetical protein F5879DRAFT_962833 [Lentinula edodes]
MSLSSSRFQSLLSGMPSKTTESASHTRSLILHIPVLPPHQFLYSYFAFTLSLYFTHSRSFSYFPSIFFSGLQWSISCCIPYLPAFSLCMY